MSHYFRRVCDFRVQGNIGHEPRETGRQLEQQRQELPFRQPQQEQPGEQEQQPGLSPQTQECGVHSGDIP